MLERQQPARAIFWIALALLLHGCGVDYVGSSVGIGVSPSPVDQTTRTATATQPVLPSQTNTSRPANTASPVPSASRTPLAPSPTASRTATSTTSPASTATATPSATSAPTFQPGTCFDPEVQASEPLCHLDTTRSPVISWFPRTACFPIHHRFSGGRTRPHPPAIGSVTIPRQCRPKRGRTTSIRAK